MRVVKKVVLDPLSESGDSKAERVPNNALASLTIAMLDTELVANVSSLKVVAAHSVLDTAWEGSAGSPIPKATKAWDALPAPALVLIGGYLPSGSLAPARMVCKAWASHLSEVLKDAAPIMFPMLAHQMASKDGNNTLMTHLMREAIMCPQHSSQGSLSQMLQSVSKHAGLQAALQQQVSDSMTSWHAAINHFIVSCPFLTKLDLSKCAAVVSAEDYAILTLQPSDNEAQTSDQRAAPTPSGSSASIHPCANAVINQQALPISIKHLLPMLRRMPCLAALHVQLTKLADNSIQLIAWAFKVEWQRRHFSLPELQISFAHPGETFIGHPTLPIVTDDIIDFTIYSDVTHINIANHMEVGDMSIAALSLLPKLGAVLASGSPITILGLIMLAAAKTITRLNLSRCVHLTNQVAVSLAGLPQLVDLDLSDCNNLGDTGLHSILRGLPLLQNLNLQHCAHITDSGIAALKENSHLTKLNVAVCREITDEGVAAVAALCKLQCLDLTFCDRITDAGIAHLSRLRQLEDLTLACCKLSSSGVGALGRLSGLTSLDLVGCVDGVTSDAMQLLCQAPCLKTLNLAFCSSLLDSGLQALAQISTLTDLNLAYCKWISNDGISELSALTALTSLNFQGCSQTVPHLSQGLTVLHCMRNLASLNLGSCKLRPHALLALAQLSRLTELSLRFCKGVVPTDLSAVGCLERLKSLDINGCLACTDASLGCLHPLKGLRQLNIGFNKQLTDAALKQLTGLTRLQHLLLNNCPLLTEAALDLLLTALPSLAKMTTTESHDAEQLLMVHTKRVATCYGNIQLTHLEQDQVFQQQ
ncbi:hypothetical protein WJX77_011838 [Trebouxia sp. C0004]